MSSFKVDDKVRYRTKDGFTKIGRISSISTNVHGLKFARMVCGDARLLTELRTYKPLF